MVFFLMIIQTPLMRTCVGTKLARKLGLCIYAFELAVPPERTVHRVGLAAIGTDESSLSSVVRHQGIWTFAWTPVPRRGTAVDRLEGPKCV